VIGKLGIRQEGRVKGDLREELKARVGRGPCMAPWSAGAETAFIAGRSSD